MGGGGKHTVGGLRQHNGAFTSIAQLTLTSTSNYSEPVDFSLTVAHHLDHILIIPRTGSRHDVLSDPALFKQFNFYFFIFSKFNYRNI